MYFLTLAIWAVVVAYFVEVHKRTLMEAGLVGFVAAVVHFLFSLAVGIL